MPVRAVAASDAFSVLHVALRSEGTARLEPLELEASVRQAMFIELSHHTALEDQG